MSEVLINSEGCLVEIYRSCIDLNAQYMLYNICSNECVDRTSIVVWGKETIQPRCTKVYGDSNVKGFFYSNKIQRVDPWNPYIEELRNWISTPNFIPNTCLVNGYTKPDDVVGFHSDKGMLDINQTVVTISVGASRRFEYRRKDDHKNKISTVLNSGDMVKMTGNTNRIWDHSILPARVKDDRNPRYSLTFRVTDLNP